MNLVLTIPGTTVSYKEGNENNVYGLIEPVLKATGGLTLAQVRKITGLETTTIQNWVKRGWVMKAV